MHDGEPSHTARAIKAVLQANRINVMQWPSLSPDLNPIEHIWDVIGQKVMNRVALNIRDLERFVVEEWNDVATMRSRCQAVVNANGGHNRF